VCLFAWSPDFRRRHVATLRIDTRCICLIQATDLSTITVKR
jgi:hypothetical protein